MTRLAEDIRRKLKEIAGGEIQVFPATVKEVDEEEFTCKVETATDIQYADVRLRAVIDKEKKGLSYIPVVDSLVLVGRIGNSNELFIIMPSEIEKVIVTMNEFKVTIDPDKIEILNGENDEVKVYLDNTSIELSVKERSVKIDDSIITLNGGSKNSYLTDINQLVAKLNRLENDINSLKQAMTVWVPVPMDGGAVLKAAITAWAAQVLQPVTQVNDLKDEKVKH